jgi:hypothetical protein
MGSAVMPKGCRKPARGPCSGKSCRFLQGTWMQARRCATAGHPVEIPALYSRMAPSSLLRSRSNVPRGRCPAFRASSTRRQSENPSAGRRRYVSRAAATASGSGLNERVGDGRLLRLVPRQQPHEDIRVNRAHGVLGRASGYLPSARTSTVAAGSRAQRAPGECPRTCAARTA